MVIQIVSTIAPFTVEYFDPLFALLTTFPMINPPGFGIEPNKF